MENIEKVLSNTSYKVSKEYISNAFYRLCKEDLKEVSIKEILSNTEYKNKLTSKVVTYGLIGALENDKKLYIPILLDYFINNNLKKDGATLSEAILLFGENKNYTVMKQLMNEIENSDIDLEALQMIFNYVTKNQLLLFAKQLDKKHKIVENSINEDIGSFITFSNGSHSSFGELSADGSLDMMGAMGGELSQQEEIINYYKEHPILFNLDHFNIKLLDEIFKQYSPIHESIMKHAVIKNIYLGNKKSLNYLFNHEECVKIIKNSNDIQAFMNKASSEDEFLDRRKKEAKVMFSMIEMDKQLPQNKISNIIKKI